MRPTRIAIALPLLAAALAFQGCSVFTHYPSRVAPARAALVRGDLPAARQRLQADKTQSDADRLCYLFEDGTLCHVEGQYEVSNGVFANANKIIQASDERAIVSLGKTGKEAEALLINDKTRDYEGDGFERVFMHSLQALNYAMLGLKDDARVEIRLTYQAAKKVEEMNQKRIGQTRDEAKGKSLDESALCGKAQTELDADSDYRLLATRAATISDPYRNAFASYLSAVIGEGMRDYGDAYLDCKKTYEIAPDFPPLRSDLGRLARLAGLGDEAKQWDAKFGTKKPEPAEKEAGEIVVFLQAGLAAEKKQIKFPIPIPIIQEVNGRTQTTIVAPTVAFPVYRATPSQAGSLSVSENERTLGQTALLADMDAISVRNLKDQMPAMILRLAVRIAVKTTAAYAAGRQNPWAGVGVAAVGYLTEQADLRSWLTMPSEVEAARLRLPAGEHTLVLNLLNGTGGVIESRNVKVQVESGRTTLLNLRGVNSIVGPVQVSKPF